MDKHKFLFARVNLQLVIIILQGGLLCLDSSALSIDLSQCTMPMGMESGEILDSDISVTSSFDHGNVGASSSRVRTEVAGGAWCARNQITSEGEEWIQIDLHTTRVITMTETQGRFGNGQGQEWAESYLISYWRPQLNKWVRYRDHAGNEILKGNINTYLASKTELTPPIIASKIRIIPYSYHRRTVCMRVEIYGCNYIGGLSSYSMPQGSKMAENWDLYDTLYDGLWENNYLSRGLGQLVDGLGGPNNFKDDFYGPERGKGWVGWLNDTKNGTNNPLEIIFTFDTVREFSHIYIHASNQFTKEIEVFRSARIFFSVGGKLFPGDPVTYQGPEDCIFEEPKNVSIKVHQRVGQYVKIQLFWASKWILISEVTFDSQPGMGNFTEEGGIVNTRSKEALKPQSDVPRRVIIDNPLPPINVAKPIVDQSPTAVEDFSSSTTLLMTAVISSFFAIVLVLLIILAVFLMRHKLLPQDKVPPSSLQPMHYGEVGGFNTYAAPLVLFASKPQQTTASSLSRDYEPSKAPFTTFANGNNTARSNAPSSSANSKLTEYYSSAPVPIPPFCNKTDFESNEYEYVLKEDGFDTLTMTSQKSPKRIGTLSSSPAIKRCPRSVIMRLQELGLPEISKRNLKLLRRLGEGVFGEMCIGELQLAKSPMDRHLVAVKRLLKNATEKDKLDFIEEVRILSSLDDPNVTQVLGVMSEDEPFSLVLEFLELGDLCQFLRGNDTLQSSSKRKLSFGDQLHIAAQIASGMKFLESKNIVHRDLATRNCVVSRCLTVKVSHFATDTGLYAQDYYRIDGNLPLPIRWMAWESIFIGKYSTKTDSWSMGILMWEIMTFCRQSPYPSLSDQEVIHNLRRLSFDDASDPFQKPDHPYNCPRDVWELMCDTWQRNDEERPSFWEIHSFLTRKNINYNNLLPRKTSSNNSTMNASYYV